MLNRLLADLVVVLHGSWVLFLFIGAIWGRRYRIVKIVHLVGLGYALLLEVFGWICPLTYLEFWLRSRAGGTRPYAGDFLVYYLERLIYLQVPRGVLVVGAILLVAVNLWLYGRRRE